jgi:hypothetical protein
MQVYVVISHKKLEDIIDGGIQILYLRRRNPWLDIHLQGGSSRRELHGPRKDPSGQEQNQ